MTFEAKIETIQEQYLADPRTLGITGFVDQIFRLAAEFGAVGGVFEGERKLRFFVKDSPSESAPVSTVTRLQTTCTIEHETARPVLRMICARLAAICKEQGCGASPYGDQVQIEYAVDDHERWSISFTNTPDQQDFSIEAV